jgi:hypothetical protein
MYNHKKTIKDLFKSIFENQVYNEETINRYFAAEYIQHVDGTVLNFDQFRSHVRLQKETISTMSFEFKTLIREDDIVFSNHIVNGTTKDGRSGKIEVLAEFRFSDDKIIYCNELTHMISGDERDRDLGSRH